MNRIFLYLILLTSIFSCNEITETKMNLTKNKWILYSYGEHRKPAGDYEKYYIYNVDQNTRQDLIHVNDTIVFDFNSDGTFSIYHLKNRTFGKWEMVKTDLSDIFLDHPEYKASYSLQVFENKWLILRTYKGDRVEYYFKALGDLGF